MTVEEVEAVPDPGHGHRYRLHRPMIMTKIEAIKTTADLLTITIKVVTNVGDTIIVNTPIKKVLTYLSVLKHIKLKKKTLHLQTDHTIRNYVHHHRLGYRKYRWPSAALLLKSW